MSHTHSASSLHQKRSTLTGNRILDLLPEDICNAFLSNSERVSLKQGRRLISPGETISDIYFPISSMISLVTITEDGSEVESGMVGREGMLGVPILLGLEETPMQSVVQIPGEAIRVSARGAREAYDCGGPFQKLLYRYMHAVMVSASQSAACNALHPAGARLCRWLLRAGDAVGSDELPLTQEFLASMIAVRRSGVSEVACRHQEEGLIRYSRGRIRLLDRGGLEGAACECYRAVRSEFEKLFG